MKDNMKIIRPGTRVSIGGNDAIIIAVSIDTELVANYEVCWWSGNSRNTAWVHEIELDTKDFERMPVGFASSELVFDGTATSKNLEKARQVLSNFQKEAAS